MFYCFTRDLWISTSAPVVTVCGLLLQELACRCVRFLKRCMDSFNQVVQIIARRGVYFHRMLSPVGRNMQHCASMIDVEVNNIDIIKRKDGLVFT